MYFGPENVIIIPCDLCTVVELSGQAWTQVLGLAVRLVKFQASVDV